MSSFKIGGIIRAVRSVHHKVVLIFTMRRTRGGQASQNGCRRRAGRPSRDRQESTRSFRTLINYAWMRPNADVYSPWDNNLLRRAVFDIRSETGPVISTMMTKYLRFTSALIECLNASVNMIVVQVGTGVIICSVCRCLLTCLRSVL